MQLYAIALCVAVAVAAPLHGLDKVISLSGLEVLGDKHTNGGGDIINIRRSVETPSLENNGDSTLAAVDGTSVGAKSTKRASIGDLIDAASDVTAVGEDFIKSLFTISNGPEGDATPATESQAR